jgi:5-methylthioadenosine/S-adenosylhomocysteine deaminase
VLLDFERMTAPYISPDVHITDAILALGGGGDVDTVLVAGKVVVSDGEVTTVDAEAIAREIAADNARPMTPEQEKFAGLIREIRPYVARYYADWQPHREIEPYCRPNSRR